MLKNKIYLFDFNKTIFPSNFFDSITISISFTREPLFKDIATLFSLLKIISKNTPYIIRSKKSNSHLKIRKGVPLGVKITLRNVQLKNFLTRFLWDILPKIKNVRFRKKLQGFSSFTFILSDIFVFSELKKFYFLFNNTPSLKLTFNVSKKYQNIDLIKLLTFFERFPI